MLQFCIYIALALNSFNNLLSIAVPQCISRGVFFEKRRPRVYSIIHLELLFIYELIAEYLLEKRSLNATFFFMYIALALNLFNNLL